MLTDDLQITTFGPVDERAYAQLVRCAEFGDAQFAVLCADHHVGYSQPIGGAIAWRNYISPSGVGYDIGCGNKAVRTNLLAADINVPRVMDEIVRRVSFGIGRINPRPIDHPVIEKIAHADFAPQRALLDRADEQLGTVGGGNHYVDLFADEDGILWVGVHFGSRGFGHATASGFLALAQGRDFTDRVKEGEMDAPPTLLDVRTPLGQDYLAAMHLAGEYAYAGRDVVVGTVLQILGASAVESVHNHHNFAWREEHNGEMWWVVRKGCTPAFPGQRGFVGATMGDTSVILEGVEGKASAAALYSTVHGAGRVMSRNQAAGKMRKSQEVVKRADGSTRTKNVWRRSGGAIDWDATLRDLRRKGIELRGGAADEAPGAYKRLDEVLAYHGETIRVLHRLRPIGVAMAGEDVYDPFKD